MNKHGIDGKTLGALERAGILSISDLRQRSARELALVPGIGASRLLMILPALELPLKEGRN